MGVSFLQKWKVVLMVTTLWVLPEQIQSNPLGLISKDLTISIQQGVPEDKLFISLLQDVLTDASRLFHQMTQGLVLSERIQIVIPNAWSHTASGKSNNVESLSDIRIGNYYMGMTNNSIQTAQFDECGQHGKYIIISPQFFNIKKEEASILLVQQVIRYKFGIFENINIDHGNHSIINRLEKINCFGKSGWDVLKMKINGKHLGFKSSKTFHVPEFTILKTEPEDAFVFLFDVSESLWNNTASLLSIMQDIFKEFIEEYLPKQSQVGYVTYSEKANILKNMTSMRSKTSWKRFFNELHLESNGIHQNLSEGIEACIKALESKGIPSLGARIILLTDAGWDTTLVNHLEYAQTLATKLQSHGLVLHSFALGADHQRHRRRLHEISEATRGTFHLMKNHKHAVEQLTAMMATLTPQNILVTQEELLINHNQLPFEKKLPIDSHLAGGAQIVVDRKNSDLGTYIIRLESQSGENVNPKRMKKHGIHRAIYEVHQTGLWTLLISEPDTAEVVQEEFSLKLWVNAQTSPLDSNVTRLSASLVQHKNSHGHQSVIVKVFAELTSVSQLQNTTLTAEVLGSSSNITYVNLTDSGLGADAIPGDSIYSGYIIPYHGHGNYEVFVRALGEQLTSKTSTQMEPFSRYTYAGTFSIHHSEFIENTMSSIPPARIKDLHLTSHSVKKDVEQITLTWTAVGDDMDQGTVAAYELRIGEWTKKDLATSFPKWHHIQANNVLKGSLSPLPSGNIQNVTIFLPHKWFHGKHIPKSLYVALRSHDHDNNPSEISNVETFHPKSVKGHKQKSLNVSQSEDLESEEFSENNKNMKTKGEVSSKTKGPIMGETENSVTFQNHTSPIEDTKHTTRVSENKQEMNETPNRMETFTKETSKLPLVEASSESGNKDDFNPVNVLTELQHASTEIVQKHISTSNSVASINNNTVHVATTSPPGQHNSTEKSNDITVQKKKKLNASVHVERNDNQTNSEQNSNLENTLESNFNSSNITLGNILDIYDNTSILLKSPEKPLNVEEKNTVRFAYINIRLSTIVAVFCGGFFTMFFIIVIGAAIEKNRRKHNYRIQKSEEEYLETMALKEDSL